MWACELLRETHLYYRTLLIALSCIVVAQRPQFPTVLGAENCVHYATLIGVASLPKKIAPKHKPFRTRGKRELLKLETEVESLKASL